MTYKLSSLAYRLLLHSHRKQFPISMELVDQLVNTLSALTVCLTRVQTPDSRHVAMSDSDVLETS